MLDIMIEQPTLQADDDLRRTVAELLVDSLVGEATRICSIATVGGTPQFTPEGASQATLLKFLPAHIDQLLRKPFH
jgi:hypothetical protein